jgi:nuclear transport factor 2 (NTF2) superfamily protein
MDRPPLPPFTAETAAQKARGAEDAWNSRDPAKVALAYTEDSFWRNRSEFLTGRPAIEEFLTRKWSRELDLPADQGSLGIPRKPHRCALRL